MAIEDKTLLTEDEIRAEVADLEGWEYLEDTKELQRVWHFEKFVPTMAFVRRLTEIMDENNHHSDISLNSKTKNPHGHGDDPQRKCRHPRRISTLQDR